MTCKVLEKPTHTVQDRMPHMNSVLELAVGTEIMSRAPIIMITHTRFTWGTG